MQPLEEVSCEIVYLFSLYYKKFTIKKFHSSNCKADGVECVAQPEAYKINMCI